MRVRNSGVNGLSEVEQSFLSDEKAAIVGAQASLSTGADGFDSPSVASGSAVVAATVPHCVPMMKPRRANQKKKRTASAPPARAVVEQCFGLPSTTQEAASLSMAELIERIKRRVEFCASAAEGKPRAMREGQIFYGYFLKREQLGRPDAATDALIHSHLHAIWQQHRVALVGVRHNQTEAYLRRCLAQSAIDPRHDYLLFLEAFPTVGGSATVLERSKTRFEITADAARKAPLRYNVHGLEDQVYTPVGLSVALYDEFLGGEDIQSLADRLASMADDFKGVQKALLGVKKSQPDLLGYALDIMQHRIETPNRQTFGRFVEEYLGQLRKQLDTAVRKPFNNLYETIRTGGHPKESAQFYDLLVVRRDRAWLAHIDLILKRPENALKKVAIVCGIGHVDDLLTRLHHFEQPQAF